MRRGRHGFFLDPLITACHSGNLEAVQRSIKAGDDPNKTVLCPPSARDKIRLCNDEDGLVHPLGVASSGDQLEVVRYDSYCIDACFKIL